MTDLAEELFDSDAVKAAAISHVMIGKGLDEQGLFFAYAATKPNVFVDSNNQGVIVGGMGTISERISRSARSAGRKERCGADVIRSSIVISNVDPNRIFLGLVDRENIAPAVTISIERLETTHATLKFHVAVSELPDLSRYLGSNFDPTLIVTIGIGPATTYYRKSR